MAITISKSLQVTPTSTSTSKHLGLQARDKMNKSPALTIYDRVQELLPSIRERAKEIEELRHLPMDLVEKLRAAGVFRMNVPRSLGGPELSTLEQLPIIESISTADASVGWCVMIGCDSGIFSSYLETSAVREIYSHLDMIQAGWLFPAGQARRVRDGFLVSGDFKFASGCTHADVMDAGCYLYEQDGTGPICDPNTGRPIWRIMLARPSDFEFSDVWYTTGLRGSGSQDYRCHDLFVPSEHSFSFMEPAKIDRPLYRRNDTLLRKMVAIPIGVARAAIDEALAILERKLQYPERKPYKKIPSVPEAVGECEALWASARSYAYDTLAQQWEALEQDRKLTKNQRAHVWLSRTHAFQMARKVTQILYDMVGAESIYNHGSRLDQLFRDATTMSQHIVGQSKGYRMAGRLFLGDEAEYPLL